jgi:hypothetical protein
MKPLDYREWRNIFVKSDLTLSQIAGMKGSPSICALKMASSKQGWVSERTAYRIAQTLKSNEQVAREADAAIVAINSEVQRVSKILRDLERISTGADLMLYKPLKRFGELNVDELSARDIASFIRLGWEIKTKLIELEAARINWDSPAVKKYLTNDG